MYAVQLRAFEQGISMYVVPLRRELIDFRAFKQGISMYSTLAKGTNRFQSNKWASFFRSCPYYTNIKGIIPMEDNRNFMPSKGFSQGFLAK